MNYAGQQPLLFWLKKPPHKERGGFGIRHYALDPQATDKHNRDTKGTHQPQRRRFRDGCKGNVREVSAIHIVRIAIIALDKADNLVVLSGIKSKVSKVNDPVVAAAPFRL
jgi:hypothetical protein